MYILKKAVLCLGCVASLSIFWISSEARAASAFPEQPIKMIVGFSAGSATDTVARVVAQDLSERIGQSVIVENKTGAGGSIAADSVAKAKPDGYTLLFVSSAIAVIPSVYPKLTFDVEKDLIPISLVGRVPLVLLVNTSVPSKSIEEFVALAKSTPGSLNYGSSGQGGSIHMSTELFSTVSKVKMTHIPYRGNGQAMAALLGGDVDVLMDTVINATPHLKSPKVRALAITGENRSSLAPDIPTFREMGLPEFDATLFFGVMGPANLPTEVLNRLNREIAAGLKSKKVEARLSETGGLQLAGGKPEEFQDTLRRELTTWKKVAQDSKVSAQ